MRYVSWLAARSSMKNHNRAARSSRKA